MSGQKPRALTAVMLLALAAPGCTSAGGIPEAMSAPGVDQRAPSERDPLLHVTLPPVVDASMASMDASEPAAPGSTDAGMAAMPGMSPTTPDASTTAVHDGGPHGRGAAIPMPARPARMRGSAPAMGGMPMGGGAPPPMAPGSMDHE
jgi:hypothetical protein